MVIGYSDACIIIAVGSQDKLSDDTITPLWGSWIDGDGVGSLLSDVKLENLLLWISKIVGCHIANVDGRHVSLAGNAATRAFFYI